MRDTPETDAAIIDELDVELEAAGRGHWRGDTKMELLPADFARKLERERDEAREERDRYKRMWDESRMETVEAAK